MIQSVIASQYLVLIVLHRSQDFNLANAAKEFRLKQRRSKETEHVLEIGKKVRR